MCKLFEETSLPCTTLQNAFISSPSFLSLFSFPARQNGVWTLNLRPIVWDPESCRESTDLPFWPSVQTEKRQNWRESERNSGEVKREEAGGPPGLGHQNRSRERERESEIERERERKRERARERERERESEQERETELEDTWRGTGKWDIQWKRSQEVKARTKLA